MKPDYPAAIWRPAADSNFETRPPGVAIDAVVLHATAGSLSGTLAWFANPDSGVSAHYVVAKNGYVYQMVEESQRAHHAGASRYQGRENWNAFSVGIEIVNLNDGRDPYPADQFEATVKLVAYLVDKYQIPSQWIVTHADISTVGKTDPRGFAIHELILRIYEPEANLPEDVVREAAWNAAGIAFNPNAAFPRYAREHNLGTPQTAEFDFSYKGVNYRGQGFSGAIVFAQVGDWADIRELSW
ncbi:MAG: N-acetylmuramoyl-L-alanine amidase [Anaerolineae bacterium]|nr:N-acetylmuramoyl-L-alanine amidase [Anaerolineae bacterium]